LALALALQTSARADEEGFRPLFNGNDLTGWVNVNCHPSTFFVKDGMIVTTGKPTGFLRTDRQYENFILEMDWLHVNTKEVGNSGLFVWGDPVPAKGTGYTRGIEVQVLVNLTYKNKKGEITATSQGDLFSIWGAHCKPDRPHPDAWERCLPSENHCKGGGEWNHYKVIANNGVIKLHVNGKEVSGVSECNPRKGYLALESEGAECWFKNIKIQELPSTNPKLNEIADVDWGFTSLFTGLDLANWKQDPGHEGHWRPSDWRLVYDGKSQAKDRSLWSEKEYGDFEFMCDWRFPGKAQKKTVPVILPSGEHEKEQSGKEKMVQIDDYGDSGIYLRGSAKSQVNIWCWPIGSGEVYGYRMDKKMAPEIRAGVTPKIKADAPPREWNRMFITMVGDRLTVILNDRKVIGNARLPGVAARGPIALQDHGDPVEFANLFIRELKK
jgi:hypothetical protein